MKEMCRKGDLWTLESYQNKFSFLFFTMANAGSGRKVSLALTVTCLGDSVQCQPPVWAAVSSQSLHVELRVHNSDSTSIADFKALCTVLYKSKEAKQAPQRAHFIKDPSLTFFYSMRNKTIQ